MKAENNKNKKHLQYIRKVCFTIEYIFAVTLAIK